MANAANHEPVSHAVGERVVLGPLARDLLPEFRRWFDDPWIVRTYGGALAGKPFDVVEARYERERDPGGARWFASFGRPTSRAFGITDRFQVEDDRGFARFGVPIGEEAVCGNEYAPETARLRLHDAFTLLNPHTVMPTADEFDLAGGRAYARVGFRVVGRVHGATIEAGTGYDGILTDRVASEFESPVLRARLAPN